MLSPMLMCTRVLYIHEKPLLFLNDRGKVLTSKTPTYIDPHDLTNSCVELFSVIEVNGDDMRSANMLLSIGMLRGHLRVEEMGSIQNHSSLNQDKIVFFTIISVPQIGNNLIGNHEIGTANKMH